MEQKIKSSDKRHKLFCAACALGQLDVVNFMLEQGGIDVNCYDNFFTPLEHAIKNEHFDIAYRLLKVDGLNICNSRSPLFSRNSSLFMAIDSGNDEFAMSLIDHPTADINSQSCMGTPLFMAIGVKRYKIAEYLLSKPNTDVISKFFNNDRTSLTQALFKNRDTAMARKILASREASYFRKLPSGFQCALEAFNLGDKELFLQILRLPELEIDIQTVINLIKEKKIDVLEFLFNLPLLDINQELNEEASILVETIASGETGLVKKLLARPDVDANALGHNFTPLAAAVQTGDLELVSALLSRTDVDVNVIGKKELPAIFYAVKYPDILRILLSKPGVKTKICDAWGNTILHYAVKENAVQAVKILLKAQAVDVNAVNRDAFFLLNEYSKLHISKEFMCHFSLKNGISIFSAEYYDAGLTALETAIALNNTEIAMLLLKVPGIDYKRKNPMNNSSFLLALEMKAFNIAENMLSLLDIDINGGKDFDNMPLYICLKHKQLELFRKILNYPGINVNKTVDGASVLSKAVMIHYLNQTEENTAFLRLLLQRPETNVSVKCDDSISLLYPRSSQTSVADFIIERAESDPEAFWLLYDYRKDIVKQALYNATVWNKGARQLLRRI